MILVLPRPSLVKSIRLVKVLQFSFPGKIDHLSQELLSKLSLKNTLSRKKTRHSSIVFYALVQIDKLVCTNMFLMAPLNLVGSVLVRNAHSLGLIPWRAAASIMGAPLWFQVHFQECPDSSCASVFLCVILRFLPCPPVLLVGAEGVFELLMLRLRLLSAQSQVWTP